MKKARFNWQQKEISPEAETLLPWLQENQYPDFLAPLLWQREVRSPAALRDFFQPSIDLLHDPYLLYDMERSVERIQAAITNGEQILVYGDYDADGITSTTVMIEALELLGADVSFYLPNRFLDGYGPNRERYAQLIEERQVQLLITVDNGVAGHDAISYAQAQGVDVIVTDHHELPADLPEAYSIIHPQHPQGSYPFGELAGVGVAFKVACALLDEVPVEMLDLVALGTVADLVSLQGENRVLVKLGLDTLRTSDRPGLQALCQVANVRQVAIRDEDLGFSLAPRLNALGRLGDASPGVALLSTFDDEEAATLAQQLEVKNQERKELSQRISGEALALVASMPAQEIYVLAQEGWHEGVLGIVASSVVSATGRPALVLAIDPETQIAKGSARGVEQMNLHEALSSAAELFLKFGGHQMAAGMSIAVEQLEAVQAALNQFVRQQQIDFSQGPTLAVDGVLSVAEVNLEKIGQLSLLGPFGTDNPTPCFKLPAVAASDVKQLGLDKNTLKFSATEQGSQLDCLGFGLGSEALEFTTASELTVVGNLSINEWNGQRKPQLMVKDYQIETFQLFDRRGKPCQIADYDLKTTAFVYFEPQTDKVLASFSEAQVIDGSQGVQPAVLAQLTGIQQIVCLDCPVEAETLKTMVQQLACDRVYLYVASPEQAYLNGMPKREQFSQLFAFIKQHQQVDVRYKLEQLATYLKIEKKILIFMIQVFFELGFVTIENGVMNQVSAPLTRALDESQAYQTRELKIKAEEFLLYSSATAIRQWLLT